MCRYFRPRYPKGARSASYTHDRYTRTIFEQCVITWTSPSKTSALIKSCSTRDLSFVKHPRSAEPLGCCLVILPRREGEDIVIGVYIKPDDCFSLRPSPPLSPPQLPPPFFTSLLSFVLPHPRRLIPGKKATEILDGKTEEGLS